MEIKVNEWKVRKEGGKKIIEGSYGVFAGATQVAKSAFNDVYNNGTAIEFPREIDDKVAEISKEIEEFIKNSF